MKYASAILSAVLGAVLVTTAGAAAAAPAQAGRAVVAPVAVDGVAQHATKKNKKKWSCKDVLARRLYAAGFRGENHREAWAIAMRESGGNPRTISSTGDYGVFQFNRSAHNRQTWWDSKRLLTPEYNIDVAYRLSRGGKTWYMWDISGRGAHLGRYTSYGTYAKYRDWYAKYPCPAV